MSGTLKVGGKTLATHDTNTNVAKIQLGSTSDVLLTDSAGNNVLSESGGVVTLTADDLAVNGTSSLDGAVVVNESGADVDFRIESDTNANAFFLEGSSGNVGVGTDSLSGLLHLSANTDDTTLPSIVLQDTGTTSTRLGVLTNKSGDVNLSATSSLTDIRATVSVRDDRTIIFNTAGTERMRIDSSGNLLVGKTSNNFGGAAGAQFIFGAGGSSITSDNIAPFALNRLNSDGDLLGFYQGSIFEGKISVAGTTVSYLGGHLSRWSQLSDNTRDESIVKGTVMSNLDQMAEWTNDGVTEDNEQLNCMKVSDVEGDINVAGVFVNWDNDDDIYTNDMNIAMTGDMVIRIAQGTTVQRGDLLMSAGDGTAKPQGDDIVRSKTIAKVTSTYVSNTYDDGSYVVPCVLMAC